MVLVLFGGVRTCSSRVKEVLAEGSSAGGLPGVVHRLVDSNRPDDTRMMIGLPLRLCVGSCYPAGSVASGEVGRYFQ